MAIIPWLLLFICYILDLIATCNLATVPVCALNSNGSVFGNLLLIK